MIRLVLESLLAAIMLLLLSPLLLLAALAIKLSSPGPVLYKTHRAGIQGAAFPILKFRTMHQTDKKGPAITGVADDRIFRVGALLRASKIDELPQLLCIMRGDMSFVGPRPEDLDIVRQSYTPWQMKTLDVRPGLASPGSIFNYTHGDQYLVGDSAEDAYLTKLLPIKLAIELVYLERRSLLYDLLVVIRTASTIFATVIGRKQFPLPPEYDRATALLAEFNSGRDHA